MYICVQKYNYFPSNVFCYLEDSVLLIIASTTWKNYFFVDDNFFFFIRYLVETSKVFFLFIYSARMERPVAFLETKFFVQGKVYLQMVRLLKLGVGKYCFSFSLRLGDCLASCLVFGQFWSGYFYGCLLKNKKRVLWDR